MKTFGIIDNPIDYLLQYSVIISLQKYDNFLRSSTKLTFAVDTYSDIFITN